MEAASNVFQSEFFAPDFHLRVDKFFTIRQLLHIRRFCTYYAELLVWKEFGPGKTVWFYESKKKGQGRGKNAVSGKVESILRTRVKIQGKDVRVPFGLLCSSLSELQDDREQDHTSLGKRKRLDLDEEVQAEPPSRPVLYLKESKLRAQPSTSVLMSEQRWHVPCDAICQKRVEKPSGFLSSKMQENTKKNQDRYFLEKKQKHQVQVAKAKSEMPVTPSWTFVRNDNDEKHYVYFRDGHVATRWYPRPEETLLTVCSALRERWLIPRSHELVFRHAEPRESWRISLKKPLPTATGSYLLLTTLGTHLPKAAIVDVSYPMDCIGLWRWIHSNPGESE